MKTVKRKKKTVVLNSHALDDYSRCPQMYKFSNIYRIQPLEGYRPFVRGTVITELLSWWYRQRMLGKRKPDIYEAQELIINPSELEEEDKEMIFARFIAYHNFYKNESWIPIAVESSGIYEHEDPGTGFSKVFYEDENFLFVMEGEPDLIARTNPQDDHMQVADHKSESRRNNLYMHNNQLRTYAWATEIPFVTINYFGLQSSGKPKDWFRRVSYCYSKSELKQWERDTLITFRRLVTALYSDDFYRTWQCEGKYGVCKFHELCETTNDEVRQGLIRKEFKPRERNRSWESRLEKK